MYVEQICSTNNFWKAELWIHNIKKWIFKITIVWFWFIELIFKFKKKTVKFSEDKDGKNAYI